MPSRIRSAAVVSVVALSAIWVVGIGLFDLFNHWIDLFAVGLGLFIGTLWFRPPLPATFSRRILSSVPIVTLGCTLGSLAHGAPAAFTEESSLLTKSISSFGYSMAVAVWWLTPLVAWALGVGVVSASSESKHPAA